MIEPPELRNGDRIRVAFDAVVEQGASGRPMIRPRGPERGTGGFHLDTVPGLTYEVIVPEIKPLDIIDARWLDSLPLGSIVLGADNDTEFPWMVRETMNPERSWVRMWCIDTFAKPYPSSSQYRVLRVGWEFEE